MNMTVNIKIPDIRWFNAGNIYTGSYGTDPSFGCMNCDIFNYKVQINYSGGGPFVYAAYYIRPPWNMQIDREILTIGRFAASTYGLLEAEQWLAEEAKWFILKRSRKFFEDELEVIKQLDISSKGVHGLFSSHQLLQFEAG